MALALWHQLFWEGTGVPAPPAPPPPTIAGIVPLSRVRKRPAPKPVVPYHVPVDSASYPALVAALWRLAEAVPTPEPYAPVARRGRPLSQRVRREHALQTRRVPVALPMAAAVELPVEQRATAPAPPRPRPVPVQPRPVVPGPVPPPIVQPPPPPPTVLPEEQAPTPVVVPAPAAPFAADLAEQARIAAAIEALVAPLPALVLPPKPAPLPWDEEDADVVALMVALLLED